MISWLLLIVCIFVAFSLGALFMAVIQYSRLRDRAERSEMRRLDGVHPLESTSQMG